LVGATFLGVLEMAGIARATIYQRVRAGMPFRSVFELYRCHTNGLWRAVGTYILATTPMVVVLLAFMAVSIAAESVAPALGTLVLFASYLPTGFLTFCGLMIGGHAFGRWLREIDPRTLPPL
jgi:hypothetical protein